MQYVGGKYMNWDLFAIFLILGFTFSTSGCLGTSEVRYTYSIEDSMDNSNSDETSDLLFTLTLNSGMDMAISELDIIVKQGGISHVCATSGGEGNCTIVQLFDSDESLWEIGETLMINENGVDICSNDCIITLAISGPKDAKIIGPTIISTS
jgi:hypothetical protein